MVVPASQEGGAVDVVEQLVGVGNATTALQESYLHQLGYEPLDLAVGAGAGATAGGRLRGVQEGVDVGRGRVVLRQHVVGEGEVVEGAQPTVAVLGQRVADES